MFKVQTVDSILSTFNKAVADLKALSEKQTEQMARNTSTIRQLEADNVGLSLERDRADAAAAKIEQLVK